jgi:hypothetical protein
MVRVLARGTWSHRTTGWRNLQNTSEPVDVFCKKRLTMPKKKAHVLSYGEVMQRYDTFETRMNLTDGKLYYFNPVSVILLVC